MSDERLQELERKVNAGEKEFCDPLAQELLRNRKGTLERFRELSRHSSIAMEERKRRHDPLLETAMVYITHEPFDAVQDLILPPQEGEYSFRYSVLNVVGKPFQPLKIPLSYLIDNVNSSAQISLLSDERELVLGRHINANEQIIDHLNGQEVTQTAINGYVTYRQDHHISMAFSLQGRVFAYSGDDGLLTSHHLLSKEPDRYLTIRNHLVFEHPVEGDESFFIRFGKTEEETNRGAFFEPSRTYLLLAHNQLYVGPFAEEETATYFLDEQGSKVPVADTIHQSANLLENMFTLADRTGGVYHPSELTHRIDWKNNRPPYFTATEITKPIIDQLLAIRQHGLDRVREGQNPFDPEFKIR